MARPSSPKRSHPRRIVVSIVALMTVMAASIGLAGPAAAAPPGKVAWLGSPIDGSVTSPPKSHHVPYGGQWALDIGTSATSPTAKVYVAVDPSRDPRLSTKILRVEYACAAMPWDSANGSSQTHARRLSRGGKKVTVGVYFDGSQIGTVYYAHLDTSRAIGAYNTTINRWGGSLGTVGTYKKVVNPVNGKYCWDGRHVHVEVKNVSGQSCYWSGLTVGRKLSASNYLGYVGYQSPTRACPNGI